MVISISNIASNINFKGIRPFCSILWDKNYFVFVFIILLEGFFHSHIPSVKF